MSDHCQKLVTKSRRTDAATSAVNGRRPIQVRMKKLRCEGESVSQHDSLGEHRARLYCPVTCSSGTRISAAIERGRVVLPTDKAGSYPEFLRARERSFSGRIPGPFELEARCSDTANFATPFARLLKHAKAVFGLLTTVRIGPLSASAHGQTREPGVHSPTSILAGRGDKNRVIPAGKTCGAPAQSQNPKSRAGSCHSRQFVPQNRSKVRSAV